MKLSVIIPAYNEAASLPATLRNLSRELISEKINHEILVVNDHSTDHSIQVVELIAQEIKELRLYNNTDLGGFGRAIRFGLRHYSGDCVAIMMADLSDSPADLVRFYKCMFETNSDCIFGSRFVRGGEAIDYPFPKKIINRVANLFIKLTFQIKYNDTTNAFKLYKSEVIQGVMPILSPHFNITIELPLKAIIRGYSYKVLPNSWTNRKLGESSFKIREMGSRYFFILLYCLIEKFFSRGDYNKLEKK